MLMLLAHAFDASAVRAQGRPAVRARSSEAAGASDASMRAASTRRRTELLSRDVARRLDLARRGRDIIRVQCLDTTLSEIGALLRMQDARIGELRQAMAAGTGARREREAAFAVWDRRTSELRRQADACVGDASPDGMMTTVEVTWQEPLPRLDSPAVVPWNDATVLRARP